MATDYFGAYRTESEYEIEIPTQYGGNTIEPEAQIIIKMAAVGGGTIREAYADNDWLYGVYVDGDLLISGKDLRSNATPGTHESMTRTLATFLANDGEILYRASLAGDYSDAEAEGIKYDDEARGFLESEYERFSAFATEYEER